MNKRIVSIIYKLSNADTKSSIESLAAEFNVSQRTVRNDLNTINDLLRKNKLSELEIKTGGNIHCGGDFAEILPTIAGQDFYSYKLSKDERSKIAAAILVSSSGYVTLSDIADNLFVSRATIIQDLSDIKDFVKEQGSLSVFSQPNKGLRVDGLESDKRKFLMRLAEINPFVEQHNSVAKHISVQAGNKIIVRKILSEIEHIHASFFTDDSFRRILLYLGIMINRNLQGEFIEPQTASSNGRYMMAQDIVKYLVQYCHITTTGHEVQYLSNILAGARYLKHKPPQKDAVKIQLITRQFIEKISDDLGVNLNDDYDFFENLSNHLSSICVKNAVPYGKNPVIDEVIGENMNVLEAANKRQSIITNYIGKELTKNDIEYITVHICAALERKKNKEIAFHVVVACHAGIGTSQLLLEKLKKHFNFQIVDVVPSHEARNLKSEQADFVISTVPLDGCTLDYVVVSPLLNDDDYIRVGNKIDTLRASRKLPSRTGENEITAKGMIERLSPIIYEEVPDIAPALMKRIKREVRAYFRQSVEADAEIFAPYLHHLLPPDHISLDVECTDWEDAVRKSAQKLLEQNYIEPRYIDAMINNIHENGPYVVLSPGFAVPHEGLEAGSIKVGMNLIRLKNPVNFGSEECDPVEFVCCLSAIDHKTHLKAFFNLVNMLQNQEFKDRLHACQTAEEVTKIIEKYEYAII